MTEILSILIAVSLAYFMTGAGMVWLYNHAHHRTPETFTKQSGLLKGSMLWPKLAFTYLNVKIGGAPSDAFCGGNCAICPFQHDHEEPKTFTVD